MTETVAAPAAKSSQKKTAPKKPAMKTAHPPTAEMVNKAIAELKDRKGSSLPAIKKYIASKYLLPVDDTKQAGLIRKYLRSAVEKNILLQTTGSGASGRFKLAEAEKKKVVKTTASEKKSVVKKPAAKKPAAKKSASEKPTAAPKKAEKAAKKPKSPSKVKKSGKAPAAKPKTPKPKKTAAPKATPKKVA